MKKLRWIGAGLLVLFALMQLFPAQLNNPPVVAALQAPEDVQRILRRACYDCHSHETDWPWYSRVAPVSWWIADHVEHARGDLNFSDWPRFDLELLEHALADIDEQVRSGEMPLTSYTWMHGEARLDESDRQRLLEWVREVSPGG